VEQTLSEFVVEVCRGQVGKREVVQAVLRARGVLKDTAVDGSVIVQDKQRKVNVARLGLC